MSHIDVSLDGLRQLHCRIDKHHLEGDDWPIVGALVSNLIAREEAKHERLLAKIAATSAAAGSKETNDKCGDVIDVEHTSTGETEAEGNDNKPVDAAAITNPRVSSSGTNGGEKSKGHGRNGAAAFTNAKHFFHALTAGIIGSLCAACGIGRMTRHREQISIRIVGQPMFGAELHHAEQGRCRICGRVCRATLPPGIQEGIGKAVTYHWSACAMLIVLHYFSGLPFKRLDSLHKSWGIPFADANQWEVASGTMQLLAPMIKALVRFAIENILTLRMDDTGSMILEIKRQITAELAAAKAFGISEDSVRTGINASGFFIETPAATILLYYTGRHHAGEMLRELLKYRLPGSDNFIKVTDGASKNFGGENADMMVEGVCNVHAFLKFYDIKTQFPGEYAVVGKAYNKIYETEQIARERNLSSEERLLFHQEHSRSWMDKIKKMCEEKVTSRLVEPRSPLWEGVHFFITQWPRLTKFLEVPGVPLDTNVCEQSLIAPVRYLAVSYNYHTEKGAEVGDQGMSLVATARANGVEPVAWLTDCLENHENLAKNPEKYFPWVYRDRIKDPLGMPDKPPNIIQ